MLAARPPRWLVVVASAGCLLALVLAVPMLTVGVLGSTLFGVVFLAAALVGLGRVWALRRASTA